MFVGSNLVSWKSKKQQVVARSNAEVEYCAMTSAACELVWLKRLLVDLDCSCSIPVNLCCDNQATIHITSNPIFHEHTNHIKVYCYYIHQKVQSKLIVTHCMRTNHQLADVFIKVLSSTQFHWLLSKLRSINPLDLVWGGVLEISRVLCLYIIISSLKLWWQLRIISCITISQRFDMYIPLLLG